MSKKLKPMTKEELETLKGFPEVHKKAIEHAVWESTIADDPADKVWPDYFRAEEVGCQLECEISESDNAKSLEREYEGNCVWFQSGWKAAIKAEREKIAKNVKEFIMDHYLVKSGDKYRLNREDHAKLEKIIKGA